MKLIIAGTRDFDDYEYIKEKVNQIREEENIEIIISGNAKGPDRLGERYAKENMIPLKIFKARWGTYGGSAGSIRNNQMARFAEKDGGLAAFWDGRSHGTEDMINIAKRLGLKVWVFNYKEDLK